MRIKREWAILLLGLPIVFLLVFFVGPFATVVASSVSTDDGFLTTVHYARLFQDAYYWRIMLATFEISAIVVVVSLLLGYPLAYYMTMNVRSRLLRRSIYILVVIPLFTSNIVRAFGWIVILGREGLVNKTLLEGGIIDDPLTILFTKWSIIIGLVYILTPFMILSMCAVLQNIDRSLHEAARDLGAGPISTFLRVTFPLSLPGVITGSLIVFTLSVSAYVTPAILSGGKHMLMSMLIFQQYVSVFNFHFGAVLAVALLVSTIIIISAYLVLMERQMRRRR